MEAVSEEEEVATEVVVVEEVASEEAEAAVTEVEEAAEAASEVVEVAMASREADPVLEVVLEYLLSPMRDSEVSTFLEARTTL